MQTKEIILQYILLIWNRALCCVDVKPALSIVVNAWGEMDLLHSLMFSPYLISATGNTALTYACAGGFLDVVKVLLKEGANIEDHNENGHTPLMEAASAGHVEVARVLLEYGAGINTHSNEFKESALTLACYKGLFRPFVFHLPLPFNSFAS